MVPSDGPTSADARTPPPSGLASIRQAWVRHAIGDRIHAACAVLYLLLLPLATTPKDVAFIALCAWAILRFPWTWRRYRDLGSDTLVWLLGAWALWHALSIFWSADPHQGFDELRAYRVVVTGFAIWPVIDRMVWMIAAFLLGAFLSNAAQLLQFLEWFGLHPNPYQRLGGFVHPINTGAAMSIAICWHVSATLKGRSWTRWASIAALAAASVGLVFAGSRGPWISAAVGIALALVIIPIRRPRLRPRILLVVAMGVVTAAAGWPIAGDFVMVRVKQARANLEAFKEDPHAANEELRLAAWLAAWEAFRESPVLGVGAGGYAQAAAESSFGAMLPNSHHANSLYMHVLASTGIIGLALLAGVVGLSLYRAYRDRADHIYVDGSLFALITWLVGAAFDTYQLSGQLFGMFVFITVITSRPRWRLDRPAPLGSVTPAD